MEKLYALAVNGRMLYYHGTIDESKFALIDAIAKRITKDSSDYEILGKNLLKLLKKN